MCLNSNLTKFFQVHGPHRIQKVCQNPNCCHSCGSDGSLKTKTLDGTAFIKLLQLAFRSVYQSSWVTLDKIKEKNHHSKFWPKLSKCKGVSQGFFLEWSSMYLNSNLTKFFQVLRPQIIQKLCQSQNSCHSYGSGGMLKS